MQGIVITALIFMIFGSVFINVCLFRKLKSALTIVDNIIKERELEIKKRKQELQDKQNTGINS